MLILRLEGSSFRTLQSHANFFANGFNKHLKMTSGCQKYRECKVTSQTGIIMAVSYAIMVPIVNTKSIILLNIDLLLLLSLIIIYQYHGLY